MDTTTESGTWSKEAPAPGFYWMRKDEFIDFVEVDETGWLRGFKVSDRVQRFIEVRWEFLGPLSPADTEQLVRLRRAAETAIKVLGMEFPGSIKRKAVINELRAAIETREGK